VIFFRAGIIAALLIGLGAPGGHAWAQQAWAQYDAPRAYPPAQVSPSQPIPLDADRELRDRAAARDATGSTHIDSRSGDSRNMAALPPEVRPETGPRKELPPQFRRTLVDYYSKEPAGTVIVDTPNTYLYLVLGQGKALRYGIGVGREGFTWSGAEKVSRKAEWPDWNPPEQMIERQPYLPRFMAGGDGNPLGARALYLGDTIYRIHGTNQPSTIGTFVSSGCIRLTNEDITDLHSRVKVGTRVVVLPGRGQAAAVTTGAGSSAATASRDKPPGSPSSSDLPAKRFTPGEIAAKLRSIDALVSQGQPLADAARQAGISAATYHRWRQELGGKNNEPAKRPAEASQDAPKRSVEGEASAVREPAPASKGHQDSSGFEE
jgi:lipoprotein-anchoring transpeptidase ErfK/SrfK/transposase-like protein